MRMSDTWLREYAQQESKTSRFDGVCWNWRALITAMKDRLCTPR